MQEKKGKNGNSAARSFLLEIEVDLLISLCVVLITLNSFLLKNYECLLNILCQLWKLLMLYLVCDFLAPSSFFFFFFSMNMLHKSHGKEPCFQIP